MYEPTDNLNAKSSPLRRFRKEILISTAVAAIILGIGARYAVLNDRYDAEQAKKQEERAKSPKATLYLDQDGTPLYGDFHGIPVKVEKMSFIGNGTLDLYKGQYLLTTLHHVRFDDNTLDRCARSINPSLGKTSFVQPGTEYRCFIPLGTSLDGLTNGLIAKEIN